MKLIFLLLFSVNVWSQESIKIQIGGEPSTLNPYKVMDQYSIGILRNVVRGLFVLDAEGELQKGIVESYKTSKDHLTYTFTLQKDALWSDGKPVTVDDFVLGLQTLLSPNTASPNVEFFFAIKNAKEVYQGQKPMSELGVYNKNNQLVIELSQPDPTLLLNLSHVSAAPLRKDIVEKDKGQWHYSHPVTGDYLISKYNPSDTIELSPNPHRQSKNQSKITYYILSEEITALNMFESGQLDIVTTVPLNDLDRIKKLGVIKTKPSTTVFYLSFNLSKPPFNNVDWRRAVAKNINKKEIVKALQGSYSAIDSYLPPSIDGHVCNIKIPKATESVKTADLKAPLVLSYGPSNLTRIVTEKLQNDLSKNLKLKIELQPMELKMLLGKLKSDPPSMYFLGMSAIYNDPIHQLNAFSSAVAPNFSRFQNKEFEALLEQIKHTPIGKKRTKLAQKANRLLTEKEVALIPLVLRTQVFAVSKKVKNFKVSPYQVIHLSALRK